MSLAARAVRFLEAGTPNSSAAPHSSLPPECAPWALVARAHRTQALQAHSECDAWQQLTHAGGAALAPRCQYFHERAAPRPATTAYPPVRAEQWQRAQVPREQAGAASPPAPPKCPARYARKA